MSTAAGYRLELPQKPDQALVPAFVRARGGIRVVLGTRQGRTVALERAESAGYRVRFPRHHGAASPDSCEAVLINTGGGMAGGDRLRAEFLLGAEASAVVTTQSAEKIYRSQGPEAEIEVALRLGPGSRLDWLPQETILFSGSRWRRSLSADIAPDAALTLLESTMFGRTARGEVVDTGSVHDRWRIRRDGRLVFAENVRLADHPARHLLAKASGSGARALATILHVASDAEARIDEVRGILADATSECGASAWNGMILVRFVADNAQELRSDLVRFMETFRGAPMPRSW